ISKVHVARANIDPVGIDILPDQGHFFISCLRQAADFVQHHLWRTTDLRTARIGHHAEGAALVAAVHDAHECRHTTVTRDGQGTEVIVEDFVTDFQYRLVLLLDLTHQVRDTAHGQRPEHQLHLRRAGQALPTSTPATTRTDTA